jgi:hypothetical protein
MQPVFYINRPFNQQIPGGGQFIPVGPPIPGYMPAPGTMIPGPYPVGAAINGVPQNGGYNANGSRTASSPGPPIPAQYYHPGIYPGQMFGHSPVSMQGQAMHPQFQLQAISLPPNATMYPVAIPANAMPVPLGHPVPVPIVTSGPPQHSVPTPDSQGNDISPE